MSSIREHNSRNTNSVYLFSIAMSLILLSGSAFAGNEVVQLPKSAGFLLDAVAATDSNGVPIAFYIQKMEKKYGDKWNIDWAYNPNNDTSGVIDETFRIGNSRCKGSLQDCQAAILEVRVQGHIGQNGPFTYTTQYSEYVETAPEVSDQPTKFTVEVPWELGSPTQNVSQLAK